MVYKRFLVILLGLLYVMNAMWGSYAHDHHDHQDSEVNKYELAGTGVIDVPAHNELLNGFSTASTRKMGLGGRKMVVQKVLRKEIEKEQGLHGGASEDHSGKENIALDKSLGGSQDQLNNQKKDMNNLERKALSARLGTPRTETVHLPKSNSKDSKAAPTKTSLESPSRADTDQERQGSATDPKGEMQRFIDATREIVNLMHKDYGPHDRPRRKPPINNKVPIH